MVPVRGGGGADFKDSGDSLESGGKRHHHYWSSYLHHHRRYFSGVTLKVTFLLMVVGVICLLLNQSAYPFQRPCSFSGPKVFGRGNNIISSSDMQQNLSPFYHLLPTPAKEENEVLEKTLRKAAMKDKKTVIITTLNAAWAEPNSIFDLFVESFRIGKGTRELLNHVVVAAFDRKAYSRCSEEKLHCYAVTTDGVDFSAEAHFMSDDYLKMMWQRIDFLHTVLEMGYNFVFTDADVMWFRDPFPKLYSDGDFQIACDHYSYNYTDLNNSPNGGFNYVKSNNRTIQFYKFWHTGKYYFPRTHDQDVFNLIKFNPFLKQIGLEVRFFDTAYFGGFCEPSKDLDRVITMHANCCVGVESKIHDIKMLIDDWNKYVALPSGVERNLSTRSWTVPRFCN